MKSRKQRWSNLLQLWINVWTQLSRTRIIDGRITVLFQILLVRVVWIAWKFDTGTFTYVCWSSAGRYVSLTGAAAWPRRRTFPWCRCLPGWSVSGGCSRRSTCSTGWTLSDRDARPGRGNGPRREKKGTLFSRVKIQMDKVIVMYTCDPNCLRLSLLFCFKKPKKKKKKHWKNREMLKSGFQQLRHKQRGIR